MGSKTVGGWGGVGAGMGLAMCTLLYPMAGVGVVDAGPGCSDSTCMCYAVQMESLSYN